MRLLWLSLIAWSVVTSTPTPPPHRSLEVHLRSLGGESVPGLGVTLQSTTPSSANLDQVKTTNDQGVARFNDLTAGLWRVSFKGVVNGHPVGSPLLQGLSPYGTGLGGGFTVALSLDPFGQDAIGDETGGVTLVAETPQLAWYTGVTVDGMWWPEVDLGDANGMPLPLAAVQGKPPGSSPRPSQVTDPPPPVRNPPTPMLWMFSPMTICFAPLFLGLLGIGAGAVWIQYRDHRKGPLEPAMDNNPDDNKEHSL